MALSAAVEGQESRRGALPPAPSPRESREERRVPPRMLCRPAAARSAPAFCCGPAFCRAFFMSAVSRVSSCWMRRLCAGGRKSLIRNVFPEGAAGPDSAGGTLRRPGRARGLAAEWAGACECPAGSLPPVFGRRMSRGHRMMAGRVGAGTGAPFCARPGGGEAFCRRLELIAPGRNIGLERAGGYTAPFRSLVAACSVLPPGPACPEFTYIRISTGFKDLTCKHSWKP